MTLNSTGPISLGGPTTGESINIEIGKAATDVVTTNDTDVRDLAGQPTLLSPVAVPTDFWGKSFTPTGAYISSISSLFNLYTADYGGIVVVSAASLTAHSSIVLTQWSSGGINYALIQRYNSAGAVKAQKLYIGTTNGYAESLFVYDNSLPLPVNSPAVVPYSALDRFYVVGIATANETKYVKVLYLEPYSLSPAWSVGTKALAFCPADPYDYLQYLTNPVVNNSGDVLCAFQTQYNNIANNTADIRINLLSLKNISSAGVVGTAALQKITLGSTPVSLDSFSSLYPQVIARFDITDTDFKCLLGGYRQTYDYGNIPVLMSINTNGTVFNTFQIINVPLGPASNSLLNYYADNAGVTSITTGASPNYVGMFINTASYLIKTNVGLDIIWAKKVDIGFAGYNTFSSVVIGYDGYIYAVGTIVYSGYLVCSIFKYDSSGALQWARYIKRTDIPYQAVAFDVAYDTGNSAIVVSVNLFGNTSTLRLPTNGSKTGSYTIGGVPVLYDVLPITPTDATSELTPVYMYTYPTSAPVTEVASTATAYDTDFVSNVINI